MSQLFKDHEYTPRISDYKEQKNLWNVFVHQDDEYTDITIIIIIMNTNIWIGEEITCIHLFVDLGINVCKLSGGN